jgi:hypothetical protein
MKVPTLFAVATTATIDSALSSLHRDASLLDRIKGTPSSNAMSVGDVQEDHIRRLDVNEYEMSIKYDEDKIKIESETPTVELDFEIKAASPLSIEMDFEEAVEDGELETSSRVLIHHVQEWRDANADGIMQVNEAVGKAYKIGSKGGYNDIYPKPPKNPTSYNFTIEEAQNGPVTLMGHAVAIQNEYYDPSSFKFDLLLSNWQYQNPQTNQLAVLIEVRMETEMVYAEDSSDGIIAQATGSAYSAFEWRTTFQYGEGEEGTIQTREATRAELNALRINTRKIKGEEYRTFLWYCFGANQAKGETKEERYLIRLIKD